MNLKRIPLTIALDCNWHFSMHLHTNNHLNTTLVMYIPYQMASALRQCKQLFEYEHLILLKTPGGESSNLCLNVHFYNI